MHFDVPHLSPSPAIAGEKICIGDNAESAGLPTTNAATQGAPRHGEVAPDEGAYTGWQRGSAGVPFSPKPNELQRAIKRGSVGPPWTGGPAHAAGASNHPRRARFIKA